MAFTRGLAGVAQAVVLVLIVRGMGPVNFGYFTLISTISAMAAVITGVGCSTLALRVGAMPDPEAWANQLIRIRNITMALTGVFVYFAALAWINTPPEVILVAVLSSIFEITSGHLESTLFGLKRVKAAQLSLVSRRLVVLTIFAIAWGADLNVELAYSAALVVGIGIGAWWTRDLRGKGVPTRSALQKARPYWTPSIMTRLTTLDVVVARAVIPAAPFGSYSAANRIVGTFQILPASLLSIYTPHLTTTNSDTERYQSARRTLRYMLYGALVLVLTSPGLARIVDLLTGSEYDSVVPIATLLIIAFAADCVVQVLVAYFYANNQPNSVSRATSYSVALGLASIVLLGLWWGAMGAAAGVIVMRTIRLLILFADFKCPNPPAIDKEGS